MCRPRFCEIQENDAVEVQQFQQASKQVYDQNHDRRSRYRQQSKERVSCKPQNVGEKKTPEHIPISSMQRVVASGAGTVAMSVFMTPLDVVKVRMQAQQQLRLAGRSISSAVNASHSLISYVSQPRLVQLYRGYHTSKQLPTKFSGTLDGFIKIARNEGIPRLWSGLPPTLLMRIPSNVIYFTAYEEMRLLLGCNPSSRDHTYQNTLATSAASGTARGLSITAVSPMELIRTRMQAKAMTYRELSKVLENAIKCEGWLSLWKGLGPQILRDVPYAIIYWTNYEMLKTQLTHSLNTDQPTVAITFCAGAISGVFASIVTTPFDVVKTHKQLSVGAPTLQKAVKVIHTSTWAVMRQLYGDAGFRALFVGLVPRVIKAAPASAILVTVYEVTVTAFKHYNASQSGHVYGGS
ncbi:mitochondrial glutathione transporter SLC25A40-like [Amphiura filiformis]|uniref:mitochondrial glutathione transporter SLC25A40-like n=1 Tax=Amphiura filiformis TaxID=82378 RepID=UPI003B210E39